MALLTKAVLPLMEARKGKRSLIINLASQAALMPNPLFANYSATKAFDDFFTKGIYYELKSRGIDVLSVMPGGVSTGLNGLPVASG